MKFETAYGYYLAHKPEKALELLEQYLSQNPTTPEKDSVFFLRAKCLIKIRRYNDARELLLSLKREFPWSIFNSFVDKELENIRKFIRPAMIKKRRAYLSALPQEKDDEQAEPSKDIHRSAERKTFQGERNSEILQRYEGIKSGFIKLLAQKKDLEKLLEEQEKKTITETQRINFGILREREMQRLIEERQAIELRLKEKNRQIITLITEKTKSHRLSDHLVKENAETRNRLHSLESRLSDLQSLLGKIPGGYQSWPEVADDIARLRDEQVALEDHLMVAERELIQSQETVDGYERQIREFKADHAEAEKIYLDTIRKVTREKELLQKELAESIESHERERENLVAELRNVNELNDDVLRFSAKLQINNDQWAKEISELYHVLEEEKKRRITSENIVIDLQNQIVLYQQELKKIMEDTAKLREEKYFLEELLNEERKKKGAISDDGLPSSILMEEIISLEKQLSDERAGFEKKLMSVQKSKAELLKELRFFQSLRKDADRALDADQADPSSIAQRSQSRVQTAIPVFYTFVERDLIATGRYPSAGTTFDLSDSGLSFYTYKPLHEGISISIASKDLWNAQKTATVRWCKTLNFNLYLIGVSLQ